MACGLPFRRREKGMSIAGAMKNTDHYMGNGEYIHSHNRSRDRSGQGMGAKNSVRDIFSDLIREEREELEERMQNGGSSEPAYPIGAGSFTEREWEKLIRSVDAVQEEMRKEAERERELQKEMEETKKAQQKELCIIVYDVDGIRCIEAETGVCRWFIKFTDSTQYSRVQNFMESAGGGSQSFDPAFWQSLIRC